MRRSVRHPEQYQQATKQTGDERSMTIDRAGREAEDLTVYFIILLVAVWYAEGTVQLLCKSNWLP